MEDHPMTKIKPANVATAAVTKKPRRMARAPQNTGGTSDAVPEPEASKSEPPAQGQAGELAAASTGEAEGDQANSDISGATEAETIKAASEAEAANNIDAELAPAKAAIADSQDGETNSASAQPHAKRQTTQDLVLTLLRQDGGVDLAGIVAATGWLPHTARAALTGLKKKGHAVQSSKVDKLTRYRLG
jgi:hypothetical protein